MEPGAYFACLGAAQTFGCFCEKPYPSLLEERLGIKALNLGYGGAGPSFYRKQPRLMEYINKAQFVIVQIMSGRSATNSLYESDGGEYLIRRSDQERIGAAEAWGDLLRQNARLRIPLGGNRKIFLLLSGRDKVRRLVEETRQDWLRQSCGLLEEIRPPKILFYFSKRKPSYNERYFSVRALFGDFPQLLTSSLVDEVKKHADFYVECVSKRGHRHLLVDRFTAKPTTVDMGVLRRDQAAQWRRNWYYPSPEMHEDAAALLHPICRKALAY